MSSPWKKLMAWRPWSSANNFIGISSLKHHYTQGERVKAHRRHPPPFFVRGPTPPAFGLHRIMEAQWKNTGGTRWTLQSFRIAANWHVDLRLLAIPYFLLFKKPLIPRYFRPRILLWANMRLSWAIKWRFWDTISLFLRWIFLWTYVFSFSRLHFQAEHFQISICQV